MRPLKLTMKNFGPYQGTHTIDFQPLGQNGLYLITGPTGSGKSTIFDAICFALYGSPSRNIRRPKTLRNSYAKDDESMEVELEFVHGKKTYCAKRVYRINKKGEFAPTSNSLKEFDASKDKFSTTTCKIQDILGIELEQFSSIVMIAQGDFFKLINAESEERKEILKRIFDTSFIDVFQAKIKERTKQTQLKCQQHESDLKRNIQAIKTSNLPDSAIYEETLQNFVQNPQQEETLDFIQKIIDEQLSLQIKSKEEHQALQERIEQISTQITAFQDQKKTRENIALCTHEKEAKQKQLPALKNDLEELQAKQPQYESMLQQIPVLKAQTKEFEEQDQLKQKIDQDTVKCTSLKKDYEKANAQKEQLAKAIGSHESRLFHLADIKEQDLKTQSALHMLHAQIEDLKHLKIIYKQYLEGEKALIGAQNGQEKAQENVSLANQEYTFRWHAYLLNTASRLSQSLKDGEPCPVCGSIHHPSPAKTQSGSANFTLEQVNEAKDQITKAMDALNKADAKASSLKTQQENLLAQIQLESSKIFEECKDLKSSLQTQSALYEKQEKELNEKLALIHASMQEKDKLEKELPKQKAQIQTLENALQETQKDLAVLSAQIQSNTDLYNASLNKLNHKTLAQHEKEIKDLEKQVKEFQKKLNTKTQSVQACQNDITVLEKKIETYQGMLKDLPELDLEKENERLQQSKKQDALLLQKQGARDADIAQNKALKKQIQVLFKAFQEESETYSWMKTLSDTANGNISGQDKIDLQASYQTEYFKQILRFANRYFTKMTNGKYELLHRNAGLDKKSQAGLNIDVKDYNQTIRDVSTLSGGESFLASLSLALGLSDCVQQEAGGFILDTMFVDEGFGTLDDETLQVVLSSLKELSKTGRLIGLISHVSELKKSISKQIVIESSKSGASQAKIIA